MIGIVAEETAMCSCNSAIKIQISNREDAYHLRLLMKIWAENHAACMEQTVTELELEKA